MHLLTFPKFAHPTGPFKLSFLYTSWLTESKMGCCSGDRIEGCCGCSGTLLVFTTESWFENWRPIFICLYFLFRLAGSQDKVQTCFFPSLSRLYVLGGAHLSPPRPFLLSYVTLPLIVRPKEFRPVFASLAAAAVLDGQPRRRRLP